MDDESTVVDALWGIKAELSEQVLMLNQVIVELRELRSAIYAVAAATETLSS